MISRLTRFQLIIFAVVTLLGGAFVGGRYAQVDRLLVDRSYPVIAHFADSGGIFGGAEVTYRGIGVGRVKGLTFAGDGVDVRMAIENDAPKIPANVLAVVANKSAIGEQFLDLQPRDNTAPYLRAGSQIAETNTRIPVSTTTLLLDIDSLVSSVDTQSLRTVVDELGQAFDGAGQDLGTILDTSMEFINAADDNLDVTRSLIQNSDSVLQTQIDKGSQIATFSKNLALLSDTLVGSDPDLRRLFDQGSVSARTIRQVVDENSTDLSAILRNLRTATVPLNKNVAGLQTIFILYPYLLAGGFTAATPSRDAGEFDASFGAVTTDSPKPCTYEADGPGSGYRERTLPDNLNDQVIESNLGCTVDGKTPRSARFTELRRAAAASDPSDAADADRRESLAWLLLGPTVVR